MAPPPTPTPFQAAAPSLSRHVSLVLTNLAALVARVFLHNPFCAHLIVPLYTRINRTNRRFQRLMARLAAGKLPRPRRLLGRESAAHSAEPPTGRPHSAEPTSRRPILPLQRAWLIHAIGYQAVGYALQLEALLADPEAVELLARVPAARRILAPIGRMLGLTAFAPKPRRRAPRARPLPAPEKPGDAAISLPICTDLPPPRPTSPRPSAHWPWLPRPPRVPKPA